MSDFPLRDRLHSPLTLGELARALELPAPPAPELPIRGVAPLEAAGPEDLGFVANRRYLPALEGSRAAALLVQRELESRVATDGRPRLVVDDAHVALAVLLERFFPVVEPTPGVHPTAVVAADATLSAGVAIGPYAVVEEGARIGEGTRVGAHAVVGAGASIGRACLLHPHAVVYPGAELGERVVLHAGACVGVEGFGWVWRDGGHRKVPQVGRCVLDDDVEIGANTTVDRGSIGATRVGSGTKIDNLVQLGHNVTVGRHAIVAAQTGVSGSTRVGDGVLVGGQVGVSGHVEIGDGARLAGQAGVTGDVAPGEAVMGFPARPRSEFLRTHAAQRKVPELLKQVKELQRAVRRLEARLGGGAD
jgi:UDP-3-O-[3-hydroxymyristoyl] glucosamine N-acyltransferase